MAGLMAPERQTNEMRPGLMAPPVRSGAVVRGLMMPEDGPSETRGLMMPREGAFDDFNLHTELTKLLWCAVFVLGTVIYLGGYSG